MLDKIPPPFWLLIIILLVAIAPARYLWRTTLQSASADGFRALDDLDGFNPNKVARNVILLFGLLCLAVFIFTPAAADFVHSPSFLPILAIGMGGWALSTVVGGVLSGQIEPILRGFYSTYDRRMQPKRFWASMIWNFLFGCLPLAGAWGMVGDAVETSAQERCYDVKAIYSAREELSACEKALDRLTHDSEQRPWLIVARGTAYQKLRNFPRALSDYNAALRTLPHDEVALYNRGLIYLQLGNLWRAVADFTATIRIDPDFSSAYRMRAEAERKLGNTALAGADLATMTRLGGKPSKPSSGGK